MILSTEDLIQRYYNKIKDSYPTLTIEELTIIIRSPFKFLTSQMILPHLPTIRFKYWGSFYVKKKKLNGVKMSVEKAYEEGKISDKRYNQVKAIIKEDEIKNQS